MPKLNKMRPSEPSGSFLCVCVCCWSENRFYSPWNWEWNFCAQWGSVVDCPRCCRYGLQFHCASLELITAWFDYIWTCDFIIFKTPCIRQYVTQTHCTLDTLQKTKNYSRDTRRAQKRICWENEIVHTPSTTKQSKRARALVCPHFFPNTHVHIVCFWSHRRLVVVVWSPPDQFVFDFMHGSSAFVHTAQLSCSCIS